MVAEVGVELHDVGRWSWLFCQAAALRERGLAGGGVDVGAVEQLALDAGEEAFGVGLAVEVAGPLRAPGLRGSGRANDRSGACRCWPSGLPFESDKRRDGRDRLSRPSEAQRQPGYARGTTASGSRTRPAIQLSTSTARSRTCRPTRRYGGPFPKARQFARVATGMPSRSATSAACNSSITLTRPSTTAKSRGTQRDC